MPDVPADVIDTVRSVFAACNRATTSNVTLAPNIQEEWLDHTWISEITDYTSPQVVESGWVVRFDAHYLGGMRHFRHFEIADIGVLVHVRLGPEHRKSKVVLLQSKRLYPSVGAVREETRSDYESGFVRLSDPKDLSLPIALERLFEFTEDSRYGAITRDSDQVKLIDEYEKRVGSPVYYHLYNPWVLPLQQRIPLKDTTPPAGEPTLGVRVLPAASLHAMLPAASAATPSVADLATPDGLPAHGWRVADFIADEVLACRHGHEYQSIREDRMWELFNRRSGPIAAAITIEAPDVAAATTAG